MNSNVIVLQVGQLRTNCYIYIDKKSYQALIIDPGDDGNYIIDIISRNKLKPQFILATHGHFDHLMSVTELQLTFNIPFMIHKYDEFLVKNIQKSTKYFLKIDIDPIPRIDDYLENDQIISLGYSEIQVIHCPGHTPGSVAFYSKENKMIFTGDLIFSDGSYGRTDFQYSYKQNLWISIKKLLKLPPQTTLYPGHGNSFSIKEIIQ